MKRKDVKKEYKWVLEDMFASDEAWEQSFCSLEQKAKDLNKYKGKLNQKQSLLECLTQSDRLNLELERVYVYARMRMDEDTSLDLYQGFSSRIESLAAQLNALTSWITPEINALDQKLLEQFILDKDFADYDYSLKEIVRNKVHILSEKEERLLALAGDGLRGYKEVFNMINNIEIPFRPVLVEGKEQPLTHGSYSLFLQNADRKVREQAFNNVYTAFKSLINTIAAVYAGNVKKNVFRARARGYEDCLSVALESDNVPKGVYTNLIEAVGQATTSVHDYVKLRKKMLGGELHMYDMYVPLIEGAELKLDYDQAYDLVVKALEPMGAEYVSLLQKAKKEGWIDVYETDNKRSGAYSWGAYGTHPYVLLNYQQTTHDVFTIAHEMGHALHSYYSDKNQPYVKAQYSIFVAEVASTVNEVLLLKHLIGRTSDKKIKKYLLSYYLDMFRTTIFRQTMFAEFEYIAHKMAENNEPLTQKALSEAYYKLNQKYYGDGVISDDLIRYEWARIPHFYNAFYVYKYATGLTAAVNIAAAILKEGEQAVAAYKKFLSAGGSDSPYEILKLANVDLMQKTPYNNAIAEFNAALEQLKKLDQ